MTRRKKLDVIQIEDGTWYRVRGYTHTECCDCALVHREELRLVDGQLEFRVTRDDAETAQRRRALGIKINRAEP